MNLKDCKTTDERNVVTTYRRHLKRKGATPMSAQASALAEEVKYGAVLSPNFVHDFTDGTRTLDAQGRLRLTGKGRALLEEAAGISQEPDQYHYWTETGDYVRAGCGLIRDGLKKSEINPPKGAVVCPTCAYVAEHGAPPPTIIEVSTVERIDHDN